MKIALFRSGSWISRGIRWFTRAGARGFSHAAIVTDDGVVYESREGKGVRRMPTLNDAMDVGDTVALFYVETTDAQDRMIIARAEANLGHGYDYRGIWDFLVRENDTDPHGRFFCSGFVTWLFQEAGVLLFHETDETEVWPDEIRRSVVTRRQRELTKINQFTMEEAEYE